MTATERLRQLLDERGVEWEDSSPVPSMEPWKTSFMSFTGEEVTLSCYSEPKWIMGTLVFYTPEQAVEATLGRGTCKVVSKPCDMWECECGKAWWHGGAPNYCPHCGRRVIGADDE